MTDLHARLVAELDRLTEIARAAASAKLKIEVSINEIPQPSEQHGRTWYAGLNPAWAAYLDAFGPAVDLRGLDEDRDILARHAAVKTINGRPPVCTEDLHDAPCPDVLSVARRLGINPEEPAP